ncbi:MAG: gamma-glutamyltransferase [Isosphaeraceae bacterium]
MVWIPVAQAGEPTFTKHVDAAQEAHAANVGRNVLRAGGNAIDAAVATAFALAVTVPEAGNLGGGGFIVAYLADRREVVTVDFRETAPRSASPRMYLDGDGKPRPRHPAGAWAAGVPGTVRGLGLAHARWGKLAWTDLVQPAARLAREGFPISADLAGSLNSQLGEQKSTTDRRDDRARLAGFTESVLAFARPDRAAWKAGDRLIQSDLAATLERIAAAGPDEFLSDASSFQRLQPGGLCGRGLCRGGLRGGHDLGNGSVLDAVSAPMAENCRLTRSGHLARRSRKKRGKTGFKPRKSRKSPEN